MLKTAKCDDTEWKEYEEKVESEMDLKGILEDLGKVIKAASRLSEKKKKKQQLDEKDTKERFVQSNMILHT